jgi:hypothetical protein
MLIANFFLNLLVLAFTLFLGIATINDQTGISAFNLNNCFILLICSLIAVYFMYFASIIAVYFASFTVIISCGLSAPFWHFFFYTFIGWIIMLLLRHFTSYEYIPQSIILDVFVYTAIGFYFAESDDD